jgi:hypothetical protein
MMRERIELGAHWGDRKESLEECAGRAVECFRRLANCDDAFARWFGLGKSRKEALERKFEAESRKALLPAVSLDADAVDSPNSFIAKRLGSQGNARAQEITLSWAKCSNSDRVTHQGQHTDE